ncbi:hypothetical protein Tco_0352434 [Tanacetum coccineum]
MCDLCWMRLFPFRPKMEFPTRWIKCIPNEGNVLLGKLYPRSFTTRSNLSQSRNVYASVFSSLSSLCSRARGFVPFIPSVSLWPKEFRSYLYMWNLDFSYLRKSYEIGSLWFNLIRLGSKTIEVVAVVFLMLSGGGDGVLDVIVAVVFLMFSGGGGGGVWW